MGRIFHFLHLMVIIAVPLSLILPFTGVFPSLYSWNYFDFMLIALILLFAGLFLLSLVILVFKPSLRNKKILIPVMINTVLIPSAIFFILILMFVKFFTIDY